VWDEKVCKCICPRFSCPNGFRNEKLCTCSTKIPIDIAVNPVITRSD
jgi:hypothetical protein